MVLLLRVKLLTVKLLLLQIFLFSGRFIFGPDARSVALSILLIVAPITVFCVFVARKLMDDYPNHWGITIMAIPAIGALYVSSLLAVSFISELGALGLRPLVITECQRLNYSLCKICRI